MQWTGAWLHIPLSEKIIFNSKSFRSWIKSVIAYLSSLWLPQTKNLSSNSICWSWKWNLSLLLSSSRYYFSLLYTIQFFCCQFGEFVIGSTNNLLIDNSVYSHLYSLVWLILCWYFNEKLCLGHFWERKSKTKLKKLYEVGRVKSDTNCKRKDSNGIKSCIVNFPQNYYCWSNLRKSTYQHHLVQWVTSLALSNPRVIKTDFLFRMSIKNQAD